ncbi:MlaD family protein [Desulfobaculum bizertense]|uniref:ABC-type transporter Mla maintaining outer membrane lipid asymmetry, component MlaD n=1 Tax=Desulfobaculum bizertense DSM 18034 TaxID=1121442 RepID=A0A1T4W430_9BACT|nr:MlaD family protein [Desulfobaculum bizertense]SKA71795.1 ABC-type transporter Mla maintaining outer membrane lipid asymmetry, component MlaD [Desulfobaculum bizertense DSM 18034]
MNRIQKQTQKEFKVGLFVLITFGLLLSTLLWVAEKRGLFAETVTYYVLSSTGENVERGTPVRLSGFPIGQVSRVSLERSSTVEFEIKILEEHQEWMKKDAQIILVQGAFIGKTFLQLVPGSKAAQILPEGSEIQLHKVGGFDEILQEARPVLENLKGIVADIKTITAQVAADDGPYQNILHNISAMSDDMRSTDSLAGYLTASRRPAERMDSILAKMDALLSNTNARVSDLRPLQADLNGLIKETRLFMEELRVMQETLKPSVTDVAETAEEIRKASSNLVRLRHQAEETLKQGNQVLKKFNHTWPLSSGTRTYPQDFPTP